jgi:hypothetical protein
VRVNEAANPSPPKLVGYVLNWLIIVVDNALESCPLVEHVLVLKRTGGKITMKEGRDAWWHEECEKVQSFCPCEPMNSEDPLFILYVSHRLATLTPDLRIHW